MTGGPSRESRNEYVPVHGPSRRTPSELLGALVLHPVTAAAIANGITRFAGLGDVDFTCRTCGGVGREPLNHTRIAWQPFACSNCKGKRRVVPEAGTYALATTSQEPEPGRMGEWLIVPPSSIVTGGNWIAQRWEGSTCMERVSIEVGKVLGTVRFEPLPVVEHGTPLTDDMGDVIERVDGSPKWIVRVDRSVVDITASLPFGDWSGEWCGRFTDFTSTINCPSCEGTGDTSSGRLLMRGGCSRCHGFRNRRCPLPYAAPDAPCILPNFPQRTRDRIRHRPN